MNSPKLFSRLALFVFLFGVGAGCTSTSPIHRIQKHNGEWVHEVFGRLAIDTYKDGTARLESEELSVSLMTVCPPDGLQTPKPLDQCPAQDIISSIGAACLKGYKEFHLFGIGDILKSGVKERSACVVVTLTMDEKSSHRDRIALSVVDPEGSLDIADDYRPEPGVGGTPRPTLTDD